MELVLGRGPAEPLRERLLAGADLHVPALCDVELVSVLRRLRLTGRVPAARLTGALTDYADLPLTRHGHTALLGRILELADNFTAYDGTYVALAEGLDAPFMTADLRLARAARAHTRLDVLP